MAPTRRPPGASKTRGWLVACLLVLLAAGVWALGLKAFADAIPVSVADPDTETDAIVVLTGGSGRIDEGVELLMQGKARMLFVSGVYDGIDVRFLLETVRRDDTGVEDKVEIGNATDTIGNAAETAAWIRDKGFASLRLVTAAYHMPRSLLEFRAELPDIKIVPNPIFPEHVKTKWWRWPGSAVLVIKEYNKFMLAWLRQQVKSLKRM